MKRIAISLLCLGAVACNAEENAARDAVRSSLRDPQSAIFGEVKLSANGNSACVTVNAKNGFGGYEGNRQAVVHRNPQTGVWTSTGILDDYADQAFCMDVISTTQNLLTGNASASNSQ